MVREVLSRSSQISPNRACQFWKQQLMNNNVRYTLVVSSPIVIADAYSQGISYERSFENGSLLRLPPSIIIPRATSTTKERQRGSFRATNSTSRRRTDHYCGSVAIVCFSPLVSFSLPLKPFPGFQLALERVFFGMLLPNHSRHRELIVSSARQSLKTSRMWENRDQP